MENPHLKRLRRNAGVLKVLIILLILAILTSIGLLIPMIRLGVRIPRAEIRGTVSSATTVEEREVVASEAKTDTENEVEEREERSAETEVAPAPPTIEALTTVEALTPKKTATPVIEMAPPTLDVSNLGTVPLGEDLSLSGAGEPGSELDIVVNGQVIGTTTVGADGTWRFSLSINEPDDYELQVRAVDANGHEMTSEITTLSVTAPEIEIAVPALNLAALGDLVAGEDVDLSGAGEPGSKVAIVANGQAIGTAPVGDNGAWYYSFLFNDPGDYNLQILTLDADGNIINRSDPFPLSVASPEVVSPAFDASQLSDLVAGDEIDLSGASEPGYKVAIATNGQVVAATTIGDDGLWRFSLLFSDPGDYNLQILTLDADNNLVNVSDPFPLSVASPEVVSPAFDASQLSDVVAGDEVDLSGASQPGYKVGIVTNGQVVAATTVGDDGLWRFSLLFSDPGDYNLQILTLDADNSLVNVSDPFALTVTAPEIEEEVAPTPLTLNPLLTNTITTDETVNLSGTGEPDNEVEVVANDQVIGDTTVAEDGDWRFPLRLNQPGSYNLQIQMLDADGSLITTSNTISLTVTAPEVEEDVPPTPLTLNLLLTNTVKTDETLNLFGAGEPSSEIEILANDQVVGNATIEDDGDWRFSLLFSQPGAYDLQAQALDADGSVITASNTISLTVTAPVPLTLNPLLTNTVKTDETVNLSGAGEPDRPIEILANEQVVGNTTVEDDGDWRLSLRFSGPGQYDLQVQTLDADGGLITASNTISLTVTAPEVEEDVPPTPLTLNPVPTKTITTGETINLSGAGQPTSQVEIVANDQVISDTTVADDGAWQFPLLLSEPGPYNLQAQTLDAGGSLITASTTISLTVTAPEGEDDLPPTPLTLNPVPTTTITTGQTIDLSGAGEPDSPIEIVANDQVISDTTVADDGAWQFPLRLSEPGPYNLQVQTLDADGSLITASNTISLTVTAPEVEEDVPPTPLTLNPIPTSTIKTDEVLNLSGAGQPTSQVEIVANDKIFGVAPVEDDGTWRYAVAFSNLGDYDILARRVNEAGDILETSEIETVSVSAPSPDERFAFIFPANGADIIAGRLTILGAGEPGLEIEVLDGETVLGSTETGENGEWAFTFEPTLDNHEFSARRVDGNGPLIGPLAVAIVGSNEADCDTNLGISRGDNYIVGTCNTFGTVIERTGTDLESLIAANPQVENPDLIYPGDILNIP